MKVDRWREQNECFCIKNIFFVKNILWNEKKAVPLHADLCANVCEACISSVFLLINLGG